MEARSLNHCKIKKTTHALELHSFLLSALFLFLFLLRSPHTKKTSLFEVEKNNYLEYFARKENDRNYLRKMKQQSHNIICQMNQCSIERHQMEEQKRMCERQINTGEKPGINGTFKKKKVARAGPVFFLNLKKTYFNP